MNASIISSTCDTVSVVNKTHSLDLDTLSFVAMRQSSTIYNVLFQPCGIPDFNSPIVRARHEEDMVWRYNDPIYWALMFGEMR